MIGKGCDDCANDQERFWAETYADDYIAKNSNFDTQLGVEAWRRMLAKAGPIESVLECGCNIGRNVGFLENVLPDANKSVIEISAPALDFVARKHRLKYHFRGSILHSDLPGAFDLVFTMGVLIHIHPDQLIANMRRMFDYSRQYVLMGEYFSRTPVMIEYQGERDRLFKSDFGRTFITNFDVDIVDYGFLWGHEFDLAGFDDINWWLFRRR